MEATAKRVASAPPPPAGWLSTGVSVLAGSILAWLAAIGVLAVPALLHLIPLSGSDTHGWPWPADGAWAIAADAGPALGVGLIGAWGIRLYVRRRSQRDLALWPVAVVAAVFGWLPIASGARALVPVDWLIAFAAMVAIVRLAPPPSGRRPGVRVLAPAALALAAVSMTYGALHPLSLDDVAGASAPARRADRLVRVPVALANGGPVGVEVLSVAVESPQGAVLRRLEVPRDGAAASIDALLAPIDGTSIGPGTHAPGDALLGVGACSRTVRVTVTAIRVRFRELGFVRSQRIALRRPLTARCPPA